MSSEGDYLDRQAALAKARLRRSAGSLVEALSVPRQLRNFVRRRPWWSLAGAACAGLLAAGWWRRSRRSPPPGGGAVRRLLVDLGRRLRRAAGSTLGALAVAGLRGPPRPAAVPTSNGHAATTDGPAAD